MSLFTLAHTKKTTSLILNKLLCFNESKNAGLLLVFILAFQALDN